MLVVLRVLYRYEGGDRRAGDEYEPSRRRPRGVLDLRAEGMRVLRSNN